MNLYYFGADRTWEALQKSECKRRNEFILSELVQSNQFKSVYIIGQTYRKKLFKNLWKNRDVGIHKVKDIFIAPIIPEVFNLSAIRWINRKLNWVLLRIQTKRANSPQDIIWCYWPSGFNTAMKVGLKGKVVFDADHNIVGDINRSGDISSFLRRVVVPKVSIVISGSRSMNHWFKTNGNASPEKVIFVRNGINSSVVRKIKNEQTHPHQGNRQPVLTYIGVLSTWIEYELLYQLAERNPHWQIQIIGQKYKNDNNEHLKNLRKLDNIYFLGQKQPSEIREILKTTDIGLVLYKKLPWLDGDSMKIYDYMAAGVPVVSTRYHDQLEKDFNDLLYLADDLEEFEIKVNVLLSLNKKELYNWKEKASAFLLNNTWKYRIEEILRLI